MERVPPFSYWVLEGLLANIALGKGWIVGPVRISRSDRYS